jgi:hypothetical protein
MDKTKQKMRFTDTELSLIKNTFAENEALLKALRKFFLQLPLSKPEKESIQNLSKDVKAVIRKTFLPEIDGDAPFHQVIDLWMTLEIKGKDIDVVYQDALARQELIQYLNDRLLELEEVLPEGVSSDFAEYSKIEGKDPLDVYIGLTVRNTMLAHTEMQLNQFQVLAGEKDETVEETKERLFKNSAK